MPPNEVTIEVPEHGTVSGLRIVPEQPIALVVLAHGAGAGMRHAFMERACVELHSRNVATLRYQFPYMEAGRKMPSRAPALEATVRAASAYATENHPGLPLWLAGKSMGGRMSSRAQAAAPVPGVRGLIFYGFPLHPPKKPGTERADHLQAVNVPMLFLQGTRDALAPIDMLRPICANLPTATLHVVEGADHGFAVLKRSGRTADEVHTELANTITAWLT